MVSRTIMVASSYTMLKDGQSEGIPKERVCVYGSFSKRVSTHTRYPSASLGSKQTRLCTFYLFRQLGRESTSCLVASEDTSLTRGCRGRR